MPPDLGSGGISRLRVISTKRIRSAAAALAVAALMAGCGNSGSPDQPARAASERPAPPTAVESTPPAKTNKASDGQGRKSAAKPKNLAHAVEEAKKKNLAKLAKGGGIARRIVKELTSRGGSHTVRGKDRVQRAIRRILNRSKTGGGSSSPPSRVAEAVRELLNRATK